MTIVSFLDSLPWYMTEMNLIVLLVILVALTLLFLYRVNRLICEATIYLRHKNRLLANNYASKHS